jgi:alkylated DNA repair dioxygenase AlkB
MPLVINSHVVSERIALDETSWVDVTRGWVTEPAELFEHLFNTVEWQTSQLFRYEQVVEERRLGSSWRRGTPLPHPILAEATRAIQRQYRVEFPGFSMIQYRNGDDGQGFHRDTDMRWLDDTIIGVLTLGAQRPWRLRPRSNRFVDSPTKGATHDLSPSSGDLLVMGGRCQADWEHSVPYLNGREGRGVGVRISLQWRATRKTGEPFMGPSFRAAVGYGHGKPAPPDR